MSALETQFEATVRAVSEALKSAEIAGLIAPDFDVRVVGGDAQACTLDVKIAVGGTPVRMQMAFQAAVFERVLKALRGSQ